MLSDIFHLHHTHSSNPPQIYRVKKATSHTLVQTHAHRHTCMHTDMERRTLGQTEKQIERQACIHTDTERQKRRQTEEQTERQACTDTQTHIHKHTHTHTYTNIYDISRVCLRLSVGQSVWLPVCVSVQRQSTCIFEY